MENDVSLRTSSPGKLHNARWLTLANCVLRKYVSTKKPTKKLENVVHFLMAVYMPAWFEVVEKPSFLTASQCFFRLVSSLRNFPRFTKAHK